ncbi:MAG TPA: GAF domain-containing SpoIIE family protein phosphatase [Bacteroidota bacterium]|nr:GAF domain-containing SpoIIE family protein phosphatase [Bacteroidota bacterium]
MDQTTVLTEENQRLRKAVEELSILNDLARVISSTMTQDAVIEAVVKRAVRATGGQQGMITMVDEESPTEMKTLIRAQNSVSNLQTFHLNQNILGWMMINKKPLLANDLHNDPRFSGVQVEGSFHSLLCVPLLVKNRMIAILAVFNKKAVAAFTEDDKRLLSIIAAQSAQILENARLYEQEKSLQTMQEEIRFAAKIQNELLPKQFPKIPGYDIAGKSIPAQEIGGDYFDFIRVDDHRMAVTLGDVTGKGLPAALLMSNVQATLRGQTMVSNSPRECIVRSNRLLYQSTGPEKFVTLFYGILDTTEHSIFFCNAGHDNPYVISKTGGIRRLKTGGTVLSVMEIFPYEEEKIGITEDEVIVIYSDGITEAMNAADELYGEERLVEVLQKIKDRSAIEIIDGIIAAARAHAGKHPQSDDMTIVVVKRTGA